MLAALSQGQHMLEADVCLGAAVHAVGHAHGQRHQPSRSPRQARPSAGPPPQDVGQHRVPHVQGGVPGEAGQLLPIQLEKTKYSQGEQEEEKEEEKRKRGKML